MYQVPNYTQTLHNTAILYLAKYLTLAWYAVCIFVYFFIFLAKVRGGERQAGKQAEG